MVSLKKTKDGVEIFLDPRQVYEALREEALEVFEENEKTLNGEVKLLFTGKVLNPAQKREMKSILFDDYGIFVVEFADQLSMAPAASPEKPQPGREPGPKAEPIMQERAKERMDRKKKKNDFLDERMETEEEHYLDENNDAVMDKKKSSKRFQADEETGFADFETVQEPYMGNKPEKFVFNEKARQEEPEKRIFDQTAKVSTFNKNTLSPDEMIFSIDKGSSLFIHGALKNGQRIQYNGDVVVLGDIEAESEIIAGGNIAVMGAALGKLHAGSNGNKDAVVAALLLNPAELTIAGNGAYFPRNTPRNKALKTYWNGKTLVIEPL